MDFEKSTFSSRMSEELEGEMELGKVIGTVVASVKYKGLESVKLLVIQPQDADGKKQGEPVIATDSMQAGVGDVVALLTGREATLALPEPFVPVDAGVIGIIDHAWKDESVL